MRLVSANEAGIGYFTLVASGGKYRPRGLRLAKASVSLWLDPEKRIPSMKQWCRKPCGAWSRAVPRFVPIIGVASYEYNATVSLNFHDLAL